MVEQQLQADGAADRDPGVPERRPVVPTLLLHVGDQPQHPLGQLLDRERIGRHGTVVAVTGQVPREHVEGVGQVGGAVGPQGTGAGAERRAEHEQGQLGTVGCAGHADAGDDRDHVRTAMGAVLRVRQTRATRPSRRPTATAMATVARAALRLMASTLTLLTSTNVSSDWDVSNQRVREALPR